MVTFKKKEETTYAVGPISYSRMKEIMDELWRIGYGRKALMEELGYPWRSAVDTWNYPRIVKKPYGLGAIDFNQRLRNGNTLTVQKNVIREVTKDYYVVWEKDMGYEVWFAWLDEDLNKMLVTTREQNKVDEVDYKTKEVLRSLTGLGEPTSAFYAQPGISDETIVVTELNQHYVAERDWSGAVKWDFGVRGVMGWDATHLRNPYFGQPCKNPDDPWASGFPSVLICDNENDRVLLVRKSDKSILRDFRAPYPPTAWQNVDLRIGIGNWICAYIVDVDGHLRWYAPDNWNIIPTIEGTYLISDHWNLFEVLWWRQPYRLPGQFRLLPTVGTTEYVLPANESLGPVGSGATRTDVVPVPTFGLRNGFTLYVRSSQAATLDILTMKTKIRAAPTVDYDGWETFEGGISLTANTLYKYKTTYNMAFVSIMITMGGTNGTVEAWIAWD
jgi:hypothetical protein